MDAQMIHEILIGLGVNADYLTSATHLLDLDLDAAETETLELELERRFGVDVQFDPTRDYTVDDVVELVEAAAAV